MNSIEIKNTKYDLPIFLPDATLAVTRSLDSTDIENANIKGAVVNTYHLMNQPGASVLEELGGIKEFMNFKGLVVSDSGGWQVFSLIHRNNRPGKITDEGVKFSISNKSVGFFSPEDSIKMQFSIGSDIMICLDDFTPPSAPLEKIKETVARTLLWAKRSKIEFEKQLKRYGFTHSNRPHLYSVVQGGFDRDLRKYCAEELIKIGFDGYGYGGYLMVDGELDFELSKYVADLLPEPKVKFALGVGKPHQIAMLHSYGWDIFDCTLPTRDARHKRLYVFTKEPKSIKDLQDKKTHGYVNIEKSKYETDPEPISKYCACHTCANYSRAYLHHLFKVDLNSAFRLATIHNLTTYSKLIELLGEFSA